LREGMGSGKKRVSGGKGMAEKGKVVRKRGGRAGGGGWGLGGEGGKGVKKVGNEEGRGYEEGRKR